MKLKKYDESVYGMINNYIYDMINNRWFILSHVEKLRFMNFHLDFLRNQFINGGYIINKCDNDGIIFRFHIKKIDVNQTKWFDYNVNELLNRKRKRKIDKIKTLI